MCVCVCVCEREYSKTGKFTSVISKWRLIKDPTLKSALLFDSWTTNQSQSSKDCVIANSGVIPSYESSYVDKCGGRTQSSFEYYAPKNNPV